MNARKLLLLQPTLPPYARAVLATAPIAYWPLDDSGGASARELVNGWNGTYSGALVANAIGPDSQGMAPWFDGSNDYVDVFSAGLASAFKGQLGTLMTWAKVNAAAVWTDGLVRTVSYLYANNDNRVYSVYRGPVNNTLHAKYVANDTAEDIDITSTSTAWMCLATTWSKTADTFNVYLNGTPGTPADTLGTWAGALTYATIGNNRPAATNPWHGWLAHCAVWNRVLSATEIAALATT